MHNQQQSADRLQGAAAVACASCRRMKMRCIGAANPPCTRCSRNNRECVVRLPNRQKNRSFGRSKASTVQNSADPPSPNSLAEHRPSPAVNLTDSMAEGQGVPPRPAWEHPKSQRDQTILLSIFSSPPISIASTKVPENNRPSGGVTALQHPSDSDAILDSVLLDLVQFFIQRLICYTPVLSLEPLNNLGDLIANQQPVAYAMAFVASSLSPGYSSTRLALFPHMLKMLEQANDVSHNTQEENWTLLQGLAVLYSYPRVSAVSVQGPERKLSLWAVKSAVETCAMQLSLHHSVEDLQVYLQSPGPEILASLPYRRSFYWIWLFVKSRHHSVITRTPPTIRNDSTISAILEIMPHFDSQPGVRRVLAEAALHHQWDKAARPDTDLAEWWCVPRCTKDIGALSELLDNADNLLQEWGAIWLQPYDLSVPSSHGSSLEDPLVFANSITAFMGVLTRFSIVSFAAPIVSHQLMAKTGLATFPPSTAHSPELSAFLNCVLKSADAASKCCDAIIELKPASRDALRYMPDYGFTMIALCCLHLVYAYNMCPDNSTLRSHLSKVEQVAELMIDLSFGCNICPKVYGENILSKLRAATRSSVQSTDNVDQSHSMATSPIGPTVGLPGPHAWSQVGSVAGFDYPMDSLFRVSSSNADWPPTELSSDILLQSNSGLVDLFNTYPESVLYSNTSSL